MRTHKRNGQRIATESCELTLENARATFEHYLQELNRYKRQFEIEKNVKNNLYAFVLQNYGFAKLRDYEHSTDMTSPDGHMKALSSLILNLPEKTN